METTGEITKLRRSLHCIRASSQDLPQLENLTDKPDNLNKIIELQMKGEKR
jgi:hypothetical protein